MAKYSVTHSCGHEREYALYGPHKDRDRKRAWLSKQDCPMCRESHPVASVDHGEPGYYRIAVADSYTIKDALKARGYSYSTDGYIPADDLIGMRARPAWIVSVPYLQAHDEIEVLRAMGVEIEKHSALSSVLRTLATGETDVLKTIDDREIPARDSDMESL